MAELRVLKDTELIGGTSDTPIYPITHTKAVYDDKNKRLDEILSDLEYYKGGVNMTLDEYDALEEKEPILYFITDGTTLFYIFFGNTMIGKKSSEGGLSSAFPYTFPITF